MLCPDCGAAMGPTETTCGDCGYTLPGAAPSGPRPIKPSGAGDEPDQGPRYKPKPGGRSGIKIRRDDDPVVRPDRADDSAHRRTNPKDRFSAEGATTPGSGVSGVPGVARPDAPPAASESSSTPAFSPAVPRPGDRIVPASTSNGWATASLICAFLGCIPLLPPVALVLGIVAQRQIAASDGFMTGMGRAMFGMVVGGLGTLAWGGLLVAALTADFSGLGNILRQGRLAMNMGVMEMLPQAQQQFRQGLYADEDGDGQGEYGTAAQLSASIEDVDLSGLEDGQLGWILRLELPRSVDLREQRWWAFMEPVGEGTDKPWLYIDETAILRQGTNITGIPSRRQARRWDATSTDVFFEQMIDQQQ